MELRHSKALTWLGWALLLALVANLVFGTIYYRHRCHSTGRDLLDLKLRTAAQVMRRLERGYVNPAALDQERQLNQGLRGMVSGLDRFTSYSLSFERDVQDSILGRMVGVGIQVEKHDGHWQVGTSIPGAPAERGGVKVGDWIEAVNGIPVSAADRLPILLRGNGQPGSPLRLDLFRPGEGRRLQVQLVRDIITISPIYRKRRLPDGLLYLRLSQFNDPCADELIEFLRNEEKGAKGLILDLRGNPGGTVFAAQEVASIFLPRNTVLFEEIGREGKVRQRHSIEGDLKFRQPLAILIDGGTASAAEIVSSCLRDHGRAVLVGTTSFGKASVQIPVPLVDGGVLRMTTETWRTPLGFNILGRGLKPDIETRTPSDEELGVLSAWMEADRNPQAEVPKGDAALAASREILLDSSRLNTVLKSERNEASAVGDKKKW